MYWCVLIFTKDGMKMIVFTAISEPVREPTPHRLPEITQRSLSPYGTPPPRTPYDERPLPAFKRLGLNCRSHSINLSTYSLIASSF